MIKNECGQSGQGTLMLMLAVYEEQIVETKKESLVENGHTLLAYGTLKSAISQEWIDEFNSFLPCW